MSGSGGVSSSHQTNPPAPAPSLLPPITSRVDDDRGNGHARALKGRTPDLSAGMPSTASYLRSHGIPVLVNRLYRNVLKARPEEPLPHIIDQLQQQCDEARATPPVVEHAETPSSGVAPSALIVPDEVSSCAPVPPTTVPPRVSSGRASLLDPPASNETREGMLGGSGVRGPHESAPRETCTTTRLGTTLPRGSPVSQLNASLRSAVNATNTAVAPRLANVTATQFGNTQYSVTSSTAADREDVSRGELSSTFSVSSVDVEELLQEIRALKIECVGSEAREVSLPELALIFGSACFALPEPGLVQELFDELSAAPSHAHRTQPHHSPPRTPVLLPLHTAATLGRHGVSAGALRHPMSSATSLNSTAACTSALPIKADSRGSLLQDTMYDAADADRAAAAVVAGWRVEDEVELLLRQDSAETWRGGVVNFEALLARMAFKIQGRYPNEVIRRAFYGMVHDATESSSGRARSAACDQSSASSHAPLRSISHTCAMANEEVVSAVLYGTPHPDRGLGRKGSDGAHHTDARAASESSTNNDDAPADVLQGIVFEKLTHAVPLARCVRDGLECRLGMRHITQAEVTAALRVMAVADCDTRGEGEETVSETWCCHVNDFIKLVHAMVTVRQSATVTTTVSPLSSPAASTIAPPSTGPSALSPNPAALSSKRESYGTRHVTSLKGDPALAHLYVGNCGSVR